MKKRSLSAGVGLMFLFLALAVCGGMDQQQEEQCMQPCHGAGAARSAWTSDWQEQARKVVIDKRGEPQLVARGR